MEKYHAWNKKAVFLCEGHLLAGEVIARKGDRYWVISADKAAEFDSVYDSEKSEWKHPASI